MTESPRPVLDAVIFDCDGVLVDSEPLHDEATRQEARSRGVELGEEFFAQNIGMRVVDQMGILAAEIGADTDDLHRARDERFWGLVDAGLEPVPGSRECMVALREAGFRVGIATSGTRRWIDHVVEHLDIGALVEVVVCGDDVLRPKPDPESYLRAAQELSLPPEVCAVIEDSRRGLASAVAAGCVAVFLDRFDVHPVATAAFATVGSLADAAAALRPLSPALR